MKKTLFTLAALVLSVGCAVAQQAGFAKSGRLDVVSSRAAGQVKQAITPADNQVWWGYCSPNPTLSGVGTSTAETFDCAIYIPADESMAGGKTIKGVRFYLAATNDVKDVKVWMSRKLPASAAAADVDVVSVEQASLVAGNAGNDVAFENPCTIDGDGVYVGYSFTVTNVSQQSGQYPVMVDYDASDAPNTLILKTSEKVPEWGDLNGNGFGRLALRVLLEGDFVQNAATPQPLGNVVVPFGGSTVKAVSVTNMGAAKLTSIDYVITTDGVEGQEQHTSTVSTEFGSTVYVPVTFVSAAAEGVANCTLTITKVNGEDNQADGKSASGRVASTSKNIVHRVAVEEFTGTGCGWCPRGMVGMENLRAEFGDLFVGIAVHQYNTSDAMYIAASNYARLPFTGAPQCTIERQLVTDPYYGTGDDIRDDFRAFQALAATAGVEVSGKWNADSTAVDATATVSAVFDGEDYTLEFVLVGDSLTGTGSSWNQSNYYTQYSSASLPEDLAQFGSGGANGKSSITGWAFNDVALASSYKSSKNQVSPLGQLSFGEDASVDYTLNLPTKATLRNAIQKDKVYVIALLVNADGTIANAAKARVGDETATAISGVQSQGAVMQRFSIDGRQLSAPQRGLNIVRMADGSVRKVVVK